jgi:hypothetical protein
MNTEFWLGNLLEKDALEDKEKGVRKYGYPMEAILEFLMDSASSGLCSLASYIVGSV